MENNVKKLTHLLLQAGVTWRPKAIAEYLDKNNVVVLNKGDVICHTKMG